MLAFANVLDAAHQDVELSKEATRRIWDELGEVKGDHGAPPIGTLASALLMRMEILAE
jgi:hypothetical protein